MDNIDADVFRIILRYMYGSKLSVKWIKIQATIEACEMLQLTNLKEDLASYLSDHVSPDCCIDLWQFAETFNLTKVAKKCKHIMLSEIQQVSKTHGFKSLGLAEVKD